MVAKVDLIFNGGQESEINFKAPGVFQAHIKKGDIIHNVPLDTFNAELKNDPRFSLVSEKPENKGHNINKMEAKTKYQGEDKL